MAIEITVPRLGWSMDEGTLVEWLKREGDFVRKGDMLFVLEGEKATQEIESFDEGYLRLPPGGPKSGDVVRVGQVVALLVSSPESDIERPVDLPTESSSSARSIEQPRRAGSRRSRFDAAHVPGGPAARRQARLDARTVVAPAIDETNRVSEHESPRKSAASPRARRKAAELGVDLATVLGSGRAGRIRERDVLAAAERLGQPSIGESPPRDRVVSPSPVRRTIAARMVASHQTTAPVTLTSTVDATNLVWLRRQLQAAANEPEALVPGYLDLIAKLTALVLVEYPAMNACWTDDGIVEFAEVHLGIAVDTDHGLLVPVIRNAERLGLRAIAARSRELAARARERRLSADELQGGTFTLSNLGAYGIDAFTPIINGPQCAILGLGRIAKQPWVVDDQVMPRDVLTLSLTFDHRLVDGGPAARFLQSVCRAIEFPAGRLID